MGSSIVWFGGNSIKKVKLLGNLLLICFFYRVGRIIIGKLKISICMVKIIIKRVGG